MNYRVEEQVWIRSNPPLELGQLGQQAASLPTPLILCHLLVAFDLLQIKLVWSHLPDTNVLMEDKSHV